MLLFLAPREGFDPRSRRLWRSHRYFRLMGGSLLFVSISTCVSTPEDQGPPLELWNAETIAAHIPSQVKDREGWATDVAQAISALGKPLTPERVCAVLAVVEQESGFQTNPLVADLPGLVRRELLSKLDRLGPLADPALAALLSLKAPGSAKNFGDRIADLRTERDLDRFFRDLAAAYRDKLPKTFVMASVLSKVLGKGSLADFNPVTTIGSMQVKVEYARSLADFSSLDDADLRERLYTRIGGLRAGTARLLDYTASYTDIIYRFADYNAGVYAARNAAFQERLAALSGKKLALDGDILAYRDPEVPSETLKTLIAWGEKNELSSWTINRDASKEKEQAFEDTRSWEFIGKAWEQRFGRPWSYARMPQLQIVSPKMIHKRSTEWFANAVKQRYVRCRS